MSKIDPKYIHKLYKKHGVKPGRTNLWVDDEKCCCPLGVICLEDGIELKPWDNQHPYDILSSKFGGDFIEGFYRGFDKENSELVTLSDYDEVDEGFINGVEVQKYLLQFYSF